MAIDRVQSILSSIHLKIQSLLKPERFYVFTINATRGELSFTWVWEKDGFTPAIQKPWAPRAIAEGALPDHIIFQRRSLSYELNFADQIHQDGLTYWPDGSEPVSWLGVPLLAGEQVVLGALVVEHFTKPQAFGENGQRFLEAVAQQTALALQNATLYSGLERKVDVLRVLNQIGQKITSNVGRSEREILGEIYQQARNLPLDMATMYIALYDADQDVISYPFICLNGEQTDASKLDAWQGRKGLRGRTGWIIRSQQPRLVSTIEEAAAWYDEMGVEGSHRRDFASWLGAPMVYGDQALGVIAAFHLTDEHKYSEDDLEVIQILASQAAVALQNLRFYQAWMQELDKVNADYRLAVMSDVGSEFAHRMNNLAGTIPVWVNMARALLDRDNPRDVQVLEYLDKVDKDVKNLIQAAQVIKKTTEKRPPETIKVNELVEIAIGRAVETLPAIEKRITIKKHLASDLPDLELEREKLLDTLTSIIKNGLEAMPKEGILTVSTRRSGGVKAPIEIQVTDTGIGIPPSDLTKIFDLFFTTKGKQGLGYGLWRDKTFIKELGGDIDVDSQVSEGTTITIKIPSTTVKS